MEKRPKETIKKKLGQKKKHVVPRGGQKRGCKDKQKMRKQKICGRGCCEKQPKKGQGIKLCWVRGIAREPQDISAGKKKAKVVPGGGKGAGG